MSARAQDSSADDVVDGGGWGGVDDQRADPEEVRVIFCALDSFAYVSPTPM